MRLLLDAHTLVWATDDPSRLGPQAAMVLQEPANDLLVSAGTIWELSIKVGLGKLRLSLPLRDWMTKALDDLNAMTLPITVDYAVAQSSLPYHHRDPFDRLVAAQAQVEGIPVVSGDTIFDQYGVVRLWE